MLVELQRPPRTVFSSGGPEHRPNHFRFRLSPEVVIALGARAKTPGEALVGEPVELMVRHQEAESIPPYERLLGDALSGDPLLFTRQDAVEAAWQGVEPDLNAGASEPPRLYDSSTWRPAEVDTIIAGSGWDNPVG